MAEDGPESGMELPDVLYKCRHCTYRYPLQQTPRNEAGKLACPHCGEAFELDPETLADLETGY
ncbi:MAG: hypothetical protein J4G10_03250 [Alphaproteobacteria bacterium]|nr:hypothetical protein [Alphaproteobacteria bacterium]